MKPETRIKRLETLHDMLINHDEYFPTTQFDMSEWFNCDLGHGEDTIVKKVVNKAFICTTSACALGSAACFPTFRKAGLRTYGNNVVFRDATNEEYEEQEAGKEFFGITKDEAGDLFLPSHYEGLYPEDITPKDVAERVAVLIKKYKPKTTKTTTKKKAK
jgi:hypothetical protein